MLHRQKKKESQDIHKYQILLRKTNILIVLPFKNVVFFLCVNLDVEFYLFVVYLWVTKLEIYNFYLKIYYWILQKQSQRRNKQLIFYIILFLNQQINFSKIKKPIPLPKQKKQHTENFSKRTYFASFFYKTYQNHFSDQTFLLLTNN